VDVVSSMMIIIVLIAYPVIREPALPDFSLSAEYGSKSMRIAAFDQLNRVFKADVIRRRKQEVHMFGHDDEGVKLRASFVAISINGLKQQSDMVLDHKQPTSLPRRERNKISSGRGDETSRLQEQTSAAEAAIFA
jgi:hypothetical protein